MRNKARNPQYIVLEDLPHRNEHLWPADALAMRAGRGPAEIDIPEHEIPAGAAPLHTFKTYDIVYVQSIDPGDEPGTKIWYAMLVIGPPQSNPQRNPVRRQSHKDVEFAVDDYSGNQMTFKRSDEALVFAVEKAMATGDPVNLDALVYSKSGARWLFGEDGVERYEEDPEASVFERIEIRATTIGRVP